jgi:hypothetical protein
VRQVWVGCLFFGTDMFPINEGGAAIRERILAGVDRLFYVCGNPLMIASAQREFTSLGGLTAGQLFADSFVETVSQFSEHHQLVDQS